MPCFPQRQNDNDFFNVSTKLAKDDVDLHEAIKSFCQWDFRYASTSVAKTENVLCIILHQVFELYATMFRSVLKVPDQMIYMHVLVSFQDQSCARQNICTVTSIVKNNAMNNNYYFSLYATWMTEYRLYDV